MKRFLRILFGWIAGLALALILLGYAGRLHPAGDSLAVFRAYLVWVLAGAGLGLWITGRRRWAAAAVVVAAGIFATLGILPFAAGSVPGRAGETGHVYRHYQKNVLWMNDRTADLAADILARDPDTVTLQEVRSPTGDSLRHALEAVYPARHYCALEGVEVLSRWPMIEGTGHCLRGLAAMQVEGPEGPLWVVSMHLRWVYPFDNAAQVAELLPDLARLEGPKILGGDFNAPPWTSAARAIAQAAQVERVGRVAVSLVKVGGLLRVPIDHVYATGGRGVSERLPLIGSDHRGIWSEFSIQP